MQKVADRTRVAGDNFAPLPLAPRVVATLDDQQIRMRARDDEAEGLMAWRDREGGRRRREEPAPAARAFGEEEASEAIGERRLADAARPGDQPGMRQPAAVEGLEQAGLGDLMTEQRRVLARMRDFRR